MSGRLGRGSSSGRHKQSDYGMVLGPVAEDWLDEDEDDNRPTNNDANRLSRVLNHNGNPPAPMDMMFQGDYHDDYEENNRTGPSSSSKSPKPSATSSFASSWKGFSPQTHSWVSNRLMGLSQGDATTTESLTHASAAAASKEEEDVNQDRNSRKQRAIKNVTHFHRNVFNAVETDDQDVHYEDGENHHDDDDESEYGVVHPSSPIRSSWALSGLLLMDQLRARKMLVLTGLLMTLLVLASLGLSSSVKHESSSTPSKNGKDNSSSSSGGAGGSVPSPTSTNHKDDHFDGRDSDGHSFSDYHGGAPHMGGFGGIQNVHQPAGAKAQAKAQSQGHVPITDSKIPSTTTKTESTKTPTDTSTTTTVTPKVDPFLSDPQPPLGGAALTTSAYKWAVPSVTEYNMKNLWGHYMHDEWRSPFASHLYDRPQTALEQEQEEYEAKMEAVRNDWGAWDFTDPKTSDVPRPTVPFDTIQYRDASRESFPPNAWQSDGEYLQSFLPEAKELVDRVKEGIYAEYGRPTRFKDGGTLDKQEKEERNFDFGVITEGFHVENSNAVGLETGKKTQGSRIHDPSGVGYLGTPVVACHDDQ
mmetsp:Transcript_1091/g.1991  ORF Transcript_1091/g.1991 Transcript_1091/m.1991 type:complete len:585 (+) Transcript_1091:90-1844(+)